MVFKDPSLLHLPLRTGLLEPCDFESGGRDWLPGDSDIQSCSYADRENTGQEKK